MRRLIACVVVVACGLRAQELPKPEAANAATVSPLVRVDALGPAAWRSQFLPTNLGSLLASAEGGKLLGPLIEQLDALWTRVAADEQGAVRARWLAFGGRVTLALWVDGQRGTWMSGVLALESNRSAELDAFAADITRAMAALPERAERDLDGQRFTVTHGPGFACSLPKVIDGRLVVLVADRPEPMMAAAQRGLPWLRQDVPAPTPALPLRITMDLQLLMAVAGDGGDLWVAKPGQPSLAEALGLASLDQFSITLGADGPHVKAEFDVTFNARERGLFAGFFPERTGVPALGDLVPPQTTGWKVGRFDPLALWRAGLRAAAAEGRQTEEELLAEAKKECGGIDPGADLFAHLGDELLVLWQDDSNGAEPSGRNLSLCLTMPIADDRKVTEAVRKVLSDSDLEITTAEGVMRATQPNSWLFPAIHLAVGRGVVCLALGEVGDAQIDSVLACAKARKPAPPAGAERFSRRAPAGFNSVGSLGLTTLLRYHLEFLFDGLDELIHIVPIEGRVLSRELEPWWPLLEKHDLMRVSTLTGCAGGRWCLRVLW